MNKNISLMRFIVLFAWLTLMGFGLGNWNTPYTIYESNTSIYLYWTYIDTSTSKTHILFIQKENDKDLFFYMAVAANGEKTTPKRLLDLEPCYKSYFRASITGSNDGKHVFVVVNAQRVQESPYADVYFMESNSDGQFFTDPIIPRSNDIEDTLNRWEPRIVHTKGNRLIISYSENYTVKYTMRLPYSTIWSIERTLEIGEYPISRHSMITYLNEENKDCVCIGSLSYDTHAQVFNVILSVTTTNGAQWEHYNYTVESNMWFATIALAYSSATRSVLFAPLDYLSPTIGVLYQWKNSEIKMLAAFPLTGEGIQLPIINVCNIKGSSQIFYFVQVWEGAYQTRLLVQIPENKPYAFERLVAPRMTPNDNNIQLFCNGDTLVATGIDSERTLMGVNYTFPTLIQSAT